MVHNTCPKVNIDGEEMVVYRGYNGNANNAFNMNGSTRGLKMNGDIVLSQRGLSLNANPSHPTMLNFESVGQLTYLPDELLIVPKPNPTNLLHCEVIPNPTFGPMTYNQYQGFLNQIRIK